MTGSDVTGGRRSRSGASATAWLLAFALVIAACGSDAAATTTTAATGIAGYRRTPAPVVADLELIDYAEDPAGVAYAPVAAEGNLLLVYFGYLSCPDVCPLTLSDIRRALDDMPADLAARVETAMITVDPERDTGEAVAAYLDVFTGKNHALVARDDAALTEAGARFSAIWRIPEHEPGETYWVDHSAVVYVVDDHGKVVWEFPYRTPADQLATALTSLFESIEGRG